MTGTMKQRRKRKRRKATAGSFRKGPDPRRHAFTRQECWLGYAVCYIKHPHLREWLRMKVRCYYSRKEKDYGEKEERRRDERNAGDRGAGGGGACLGPDSGGEPPW